MKLLKNITDNKFKTENIKKFREACRVVLFDENNLVALMYVSKYKYHKIPGGGIDKGENKTEALTREAKEEAGCKIRVICEIGKVSEYRSEWGLKQISYAYIGKVLSKGQTSFTKKERADGFKVLWMSLDDAISKMKQDNTTDYHGKCLKQRDLTILLKAKQMIKNDSKLRKIFVK